MLILKVSDILTLHLGHHVIIAGPHGSAIPLTHEQLALVGYLAEEYAKCCLCKGEGQVVDNDLPKLGLVVCWGCDGEGWNLSEKGLGLLAELQATYVRNELSESSPIKAERMVMRHKTEANRYTPEGLQVRPSQPD